MTTIVAGKDDKGYYLATDSCLLIPSTLSSGGMFTTIKDKIFKSSCGRVAMIITGWLPDQKIADLLMQAFQDHIRSSPDITAWVFPKALHAVARENIICFFMVATGVYRCDITEISLIKGLRVVPLPDHLDMMAEGSGRGASRALLNQGLSATRLLEIVASVDDTTMLPAQQLYASELLPLVTTCLTGDAPDVL